MSHQEKSSSKLGSKPSPESGHSWDAKIKVLRTSALLEILEGRQNNPVKGVQRQKILFCKPSSLNFQVL